MEVFLTIDTVPCTEYRMAPVREHGTAIHSWERLPLAALATVTIVVIKSSAIFGFDERQRVQSGRNSTAWVTHLATHLDLNVLPNLPDPYGTEYTSGTFEETGLHGGTLRVTRRMLYELADSLGVLQNLPVLPRTQDILFPVPLVPSVYECPVCNHSLKRSSNGIASKAWVVEPSGAYQTPVFLGECSHCRTFVHPDRHIKIYDDGHEEDIYDHDAPVILIGWGRYAT
jgi:hypothetical protein